MSLPPLPVPDTLELIRVALPLVRPHRTAHGVEQVRQSTLVRAVLADSTEGWGECPALDSVGYSGETAASAFEQMRDVLAGVFLRGSALDTTSHPMARAAIQEALLDAALRREGRRLASALGPGADRVETCAVVSAASTDDLLATVAVRVEEGYGAVSLKVRPGWSVEPLRAVSSAWPGLTLSADANGSFDEASTELAEVGELGLAYLEQPLAASDIDANARLSAAWETPLALDESIGTADDVKRVSQLGGQVIINVKPARVGGLYETLRVLAAVEETGQEALCGGMLETGIGRAHALAVAGLDACGHPTHLGPSGNYFTSDLVRPFVLGPDATLRVPDGPGIGVTPDPAMLAQTTVEAVVIEA